MSAQQYGMDPNQFAQAIDQQGQIPAMVAEVARRKALAAVLEHATVTDSHGESIDLAELTPRPAFEAGGLDDVDNLDDLAESDVHDDRS